MSYNTASCIQFPLYIIALTCSYVAVSDSNEQCGTRVAVLSVSLAWTGPELYALDPWMLHALVPLT